MTTIDVAPVSNKVPNFKRLLPYLGLLLIVSFAQYSLSLDNRFVWDSEIVFVADTSIRDLKNLPRSFLEPFDTSPVSFGSKVSRLKYYRPLTKSLHILEYQVFGTDPLGYKAVNIVLNAAVVLLLFMVVLSATKHPTVALVAALLYAVNPTRAEAVYWAYSDSYILMSIFSLGALLLYQRRHLILALIAFSLALLCQELAVLLPVIILLYVFLIEGERSLKAYVPIFLFFMLTGVYLVIRTAIVGPVPLGGMELGALLNTVVVVILRYLKIFFLPDAPVTIYASQMFVSRIPEVIISYAVVGLLVAFGVWLWFRRRAYLFWYLWFFVWLSVYLNFGVGAEYFMAEKSLYLASAGLCVLLATLLVEFDNKKMLVYGLLGSLAMFHSAITFSRDTYWQDTRTYIQKGLEFAPDFYLAHYALGLDYVKTRENDKALAQFIRTTVLHPNFPLSYNAMGIIYSQQNEMDMAISAHKKAIALDPGNPLFFRNLNRAIKKKNNLFAEYLEMGNYLASTGKTQLAIQQYEKSIALAGPNDKVGPMEALGKILGQSGNPDRSLDIYRQITTLEPTRSSAWVGVGNNLWTMGKNV